MILQAIPPFSLNNPMARIHPCQRPPRSHTKFVEQILDQGVELITLRLFCTLAAADYVIHNEGNARRRPIYLCFEGEVSEGQWCLEVSI